MLEITKGIGFIKASAIIIINMVTFQNFISVNLGYVLPSSLIFIVFARRK